jgi:hypothetical protein
MPTQTNNWKDLVAVAVALGAALQKTSPKVSIEARDWPERDRVKVGDVVTGVEVKNGRITKRQRSEAIRIWANVTLYHKVRGDAVLGAVEANCGALIAAAQRGFRGKSVEAVLAEPNFPWSE